MVAVVPPKGSVPHGHAFEDPDMFVLLIGKLLKAFEDISRGDQGCHSNVFFEIYLCLRP